MAAAKVQFSAASLPRLLSAARANAFDIRIRQVEFAQQGFKVALSKNERFPAISVGPFYSMENAIDREQRAGTRHLIAAAAVGPQRWEHCDQ